jgi:hypothetical protein
MRLFVNKGFIFPLIVLQFSSMRRTTANCIYWGCAFYIPAPPSSQDQVLGSNTFFAFLYPKLPRPPALTAGKDWHTMKSNNNYAKFCHHSFAVVVHNPIYQTAWLDKRTLSLKNYATKYYLDEKSTVFA